MSKFKILVSSQPQSLHAHDGPKVRFLPVAGHSFFYCLNYSAQFKMPSSLSTAVFIASCFRMVYTDGSVDRPTRCTFVNHLRSLTSFSTVNVNEAAALLLGLTFGLAFFFPHFPQRRLSHLAAFIDLFWNNFSKLLYVSLYRLWTNKVLCHLIWSTCWYRESVQHCMCSRSCPVHLRMCVGDLWPFPFLMTPLLTLCLAITFSSSFPNNFSF